MANGSPLQAPFTLEELRDRISELNDADAFLKKAIAAGIDMSKQQAQTAEIRQQLMKFAQAFYPGQL